MKNKKGDISITILVIGIILVCTLALISFFLSTLRARDSFVGVNIIKKLNSQVEENYFYEKQTGINARDPLVMVKNALAYAKKTSIINRNCYCGDECDSYANFIVESASKNGIYDPLLLAALMMQESACKANAASSSSIGLMQINLIHCGNYGLPSDKDKCKTELINNPHLNIEIGAQILKEDYNMYKNGKVFQGCSNKNILYSEWEAALRGYNGWGCDNVLFAQDNFVEEISQRYNALKQISGNYFEKRDTQGFLFWTEEVISFSAEYEGEP